MEGSEERREKNEEIPSSFVLAGFCCLGSLGQNKTKSVVRDPDSAQITCINNISR